MNARSWWPAPLVFAFLAAPACADTSVATVPSGYITLTAAAGSGAGATPSVLAFPLQGLAMAGGQMTGAVTGISSSTIANSNAAWTPGALSQAATPFLLELTSGTACGRTFVISTATPNSATTVTLDLTDAPGIDLTTLGINPGDTYEILPADTLLGLLGTPSTTGVLGQAGSATQCDQVQLLLPGGWASFYFDTGAGHWLPCSGAPTVSDDVVIRPDTGVIYNRYATTALNVTLTGRVPSVARQASVLSSGATALANSWPTDLTLASSSLQTLPGWTPGFDTVQVYNAATGWRAYVYDGAHWRLATPPHVLSDQLALPAGTFVIINKAGSASGSSILSQALPYPLAP